MGEHLDRKSRLPSPVEITVKAMTLGLDVSFEAARIAKTQGQRLGEKALALAREKLIEEEKFLTPTSDTPVPTSHEVEQHSMRAVTEGLSDETEEEPYFGIPYQRIDAFKQAHHRAETNILDAHDRVLTPS